jgi:hypothetical protein
VSTSQKIVLLDAIFSPPDCRRRSRQAYYISDKRRRLCKPPRQELYKLMTK